MPLSQTAANPRHQGEEKRKKQHAQNKQKMHEGKMERQYSNHERQKVTTRQPTKDSNSSELS